MRVHGKVAFITGAARGQGRSHAVKLAEEGADIIAVDLCAEIESVPYALATPGDLEQTVKEVEALGRRIVPIQADVRSLAAMRAAVAQGVAELGRIDIALANAGIMGLPAPEDDEAAVRSFADALDVMLTGPWNTIRAVSDPMIAQGDGGSIVLTSSTSGDVKGGRINSPGGQGYAAAKHGVVGLMRTFANFLAEHRIRVNAVAPTGVNTDMANNPTMQAFLANVPVTSGDMANLLPVRVIEPVDVSNAILYLVSEEGRYVTGTFLPVDAGYLIR